MQRRRNKTLAEKLANADSVARLGSASTRAEHSEGHAMQRIGERLVEVRRASGLGVRGFAAAITRVTGYEISHTSVANYESGTTVPAGYAVAVSRTFSVGLPWLLTGEGLASEVDQPELEDAFRRIAAIVSEALPGLRGVEADQDAFFRASPDLFVILNEAGEIVRANPAWDALLGQPVRQLERTLFSSLVHEDDREALARMLQLNGAGVRPTELRVKSARSEWVPITLRVSHVGGLAYGVGRWTPPDRRNRNDWRRIVNEVLDDATDMFVLFDDSARCLAANRAAATVLGRPPSSMVGVSAIDELIAPGKRDGARAALRSLLDGGSLEQEIVMHGGHGGPIRVLGRAVANVEPGVHLGFAYARRDLAKAVSAQPGAGADSV
jgi:PAS domain S-box-containing protein